MPADLPPLELGAAATPAPACAPFALLGAALEDAPVAAAVLAGAPPLLCFANHRFVQLLGRDALLGHPLREALPAAGDQLLGQWLRSGARQGLSVELSLAELWGGTPDRLVRARLQPLPASDGSPQAVLLTLAENTIELRARRALEQAHEERARLQSELKDTRRRHDDYTATLGHSLRSALAPIVSTLDLLQLRAQEDLAPQLGTMVRSTRKLSELADRMLQAAHGHAFNTQRLPVAALVARAAENASAMMDGHRLEFVVHAVDESLSCDCDPEGMLQVLAHLLNNAARFTPPGGRVELSAERRRDELLLRVRDNGIGMPQDMLPRVWAPFFQGAAPSGAPPGIGMGLTVAQSLVNLHGGTITASSEGPGRGSEFTVRLPLQRSASDPAAPAAAYAPLRVLVVDDNEDSAEAMASLLGMLGHQVAIAVDPLEALTQADELKPQLALLDLDLPRMDGWELARHLRRKPWGPQCRLVAISAWGREDHRQRSAQAGFEHHLVKPVTLALLLRALAQQVGAPDG
jgi:signal transduction histidine kinase/CheY-like chemotaxis protein